MDKSTKKLIAVVGTAVGVTAIVVTGIHFALKKFRSDMEAMNMDDDTDWFSDGCQGHIDMN